MRRLGGAARACYAAFIRGDMARSVSEKSRSVRSLLSALGVTRVARVTGLDRAGIEVACAVRPGGHVLQVTNGKGLTWARARVAAVSEAAELWASERVDPDVLVFGARKELRRAWVTEIAAPWLWSD